MKILHTSDLHLGKSLVELSFYDDQKYILNEIIKIIKEKGVDVVLIAGDIYDKNIPSVDAVNLFNDFLNELNSINVEVIIISGNHDSNDRLSFGSSLFDRLNIHIEAIYDGSLKKYSFNDCDIYALPFVKPFHLKKFMKEDEYLKINNANDMMKWILDREKMDKNKKNILVLHQFVMSLKEDILFSDSESGVSVGMLDACDVKIFDDFDYVALGHIHRGQKVGRDTVRYCGTPLKYSFSEVNNKNGVIIYDTLSDNIEFVLLEPLRNMKVIRGYFEDILKMEASDDLIKIELEDDNTIISPMEEIKKKFPNALSLVFVSKKNDFENSDMSYDIKTTSVVDLFKDFYKAQYGDEMSKNEEEYFNDLVACLEEDYED